MTSDGSVAMYMCGCSDCHCPETENKIDVVGGKVTDKPSSVDLAAEP